jgi:hypothetical protein
MAIGCPDPTVILLLLDAAHAAALSEGNFGWANQRPDQSDHGRDQSAHPASDSRKSQVLDLIVRYEYGMPFVLASNQVRNVVDGPGTLPSVSFGSWKF